MAGEIEERLHDLAVRIDRLRVLYEQHFLGMEKLPPVVARREAERLINALGNENIGNTALRFRYMNLVRRWKLHAERWDKVVREIENGTYKPHLVLRQKRSERERGASGRAPPPPPPSPIPGMSDAELRSLHARYLEACRTVGDRREVRYESMVGSLQKQMPALLEKNRVSAVAFEVVVKDGRVVLRAMPRKDPAAPPVA